MFKKKDSCMTIKEIVERNVGMPAEQFTARSELPYIKNLKEAVSLFKELAHKKVPVTIIGDYDTDGICATAIMYHGCKLYGAEPKTRLPRRFTEGYGLSEKIIDEIDTGLVITVDNGIAAFSAIEKAKEKGLHIIIIDHHLAPVDKDRNKTFPTADIIVDPATEEDSEFHGYCGAGLAFRFVQELFPKAALSKLKVLASIATVADVMELHGANRTLVEDGLKIINQNNVLPALRLIMATCNLTDHIVEDDYGYRFGPIFNASSRLFDNGADRVLETLKVVLDDQKLPDKVSNLIQTNEARKGLVRQAMKIAEPLVGKDRPIVLYDPRFGEGIIGIIAGELCEKYQCPAIVFTKSQNGILKGSGRSIPEIHLKETLDKINHLMIGYGGHAGAAGLSINEASLFDFKYAFKEACGKLPKKSNDILYDLDLDCKNISTFVKEQNKYAPYGEGNPKILVKMVLHLSPYNYKTIGDGSHFMVTEPDLTVLGFGLAKKYEEAGYPQLIECVGYVRESWFKGNCEYRFEIVDFIALDQGNLQHKAKNEYLPTVAGCFDIEDINDIDDIQMLSFN